MTVRVTKRRVKREGLVVALSVLAILSIASDSCGNAARDNALHSPSQRLLGRHINLPNTLTGLLERGSLSKPELQAVIEADRAWFRERKQSESLPFMPGRRRGVDADSTRYSLSIKGHGNGVSLRGKDLLWANLTRSTEDDQDLFGFQMNGSDLSSLSQPGFKGAYKKPNGEVVYRSFTDLRKANLLGASLRSANLNDSDLRGAVFLGVDFDSATLRSADLYGADLRWAEFVRADLTNADFNNVDLAGALYEPLGGAHPEIASFISARTLVSGKALCRIRQILNRQ